MSILRIQNFVYEYKSLIVISSFLSKSSFNPHFYIQKIMNTQETNPPDEELVNPDVVSSQVIGFLVGIASGYLIKKGEDILEESDKTLESQKKKLGKNECEKIRGTKASEAKKALGALIKKRHLRKVVHAFYVIYKYLEKHT